MESMMLMICLVVTIGAAYYMGKTDGEKTVHPSDEAWTEVKKHEIDMRFAHMRWMAEREHHDNL